jgi:hypothetical protein
MFFEWELCNGKIWVWFDLLKESIFEETIAKLSPKECLGGSQHSDRKQFQEQNMWEKEPDVI